MTSFTMPIAATSAGNLIVVSVGKTGSTVITSLTDNAGNTYLDTGSTNPHSILRYAFNSVAGATSLSISFSGVEDVYSTIYEFSGVKASSDPLDSQGSSAPPTSTGPFLGVTLTPSVVGELLVAQGLAGSANVLSVDPPWLGAPANAGFPRGQETAYYINAPLSPQQPTFHTSGQSSPYGSSGASFLPAGAHITVTISESGVLSEAEISNDTKTITEILLAVETIIKSRNPIGPMDDVLLEDWIDIMAAPANRWIEADS